MFALLLSTALAAAQPPTEVATGIYLYSVSEVDVARGTYLVDGFVWFRWKGERLGDGPFEMVLVNGTIESSEDAKVVSEGDVHRYSRRFSARLRSHFDLRDYPFDRQLLPILIEHRWLGPAQLVFVPDDGAIPAGSTSRRAFLASEATVQDWDVEDVRHTATIKTYETDFGSIQKGVWDGKSSRYVYEIHVRRPFTPYLVKFVIPLIVIVMMAFATFFIHPDAFEVQGGIAVTALLSCVAFHVAQSSALPAVGYLVRADKFFLLSYVLIFLALAAIVRVHQLHRAGAEVKVNRLLNFGRFGFPLIFAASLVWLVFVR